MPDYCLDSQPNNNGVHKVHVHHYSPGYEDDGCPYKPPLARIRYLGTHATAVPALHHARIIWMQWLSEGCLHCCPETRGNQDYMQHDH